MLVKHDTVNDQTLVSIIIRCCNEQGHIGRLLSSIFDQTAAKELGIAIRNTPGAFNEPVADQVLGYMLSFARRIPWIDQRMKAGEWENLSCFSLRDRTLRFCNRHGCDCRWRNRSVPE